MPTTKTKLGKDVKAIVADYQSRIGNRPGLVSGDLQKALLAACVMSVLIQRASYIPDQTIKGYADLYFEARSALLLNTSDTETDRIVAEKFGV